METLLVFGVLQIAIFIAPATLYFVFASFMARRRYWAYVASMVVGSLHGLALAGILFVGMIAAAHRAHGESCIIVLVVVLKLVIAVLLVIHCAQALPVLKTIVVDDSGPRGFEPIMPLSQLQHPKRQRDGGGGKD